MGGYMAKLTTYDNTGKVLFDSQKVIYSLIKADHLQYLGKNVADEATLRAIVINKLIHILYMDVISTDAPIAFIHYDGDVHDKYGIEGGWEAYKLIAPLSVCRINTNTYRFYFFSLTALNEQQLSCYRIYVYDKAKSRASVGLTTYDKAGNITFSTHHPPLKVVDYRTPALPHQGDKVHLIRGVFINQLASYFLDELKASNQAYGKQASDIIHALHQYITTYLNDKNSIQHDNIKQFISNYFIRHDFNDLFWYCNMPDVYRHMRHQDKKYATFYHLGVTELPARYSYYGNGAYQPCIFTAMGVNGGVIAGASMMTTPLVMDVNAKLDYDFEQYPQHPAIMMADVTDLPFPYHA